MPYSLSFYLYFYSLTNIPNSYTQYIPKRKTGVFLSAFISLTNRINSHNPFLILFYPLTYMTNSLLRSTRISTQSAWKPTSRTEVSPRRTQILWRLWGTPTSSLLPLALTRPPSMFAGLCGGSCWSGIKCKKCWWLCGRVRSVCRGWSEFFLNSITWAFFFVFVYCWCFFFLNLLARTRRCNIKFHLYIKRILRYLIHELPDTRYWSF